MWCVRNGCWVVDVFLLPRNDCCWLVSVGVGWGYGCIAGVANITLCDGG